tara:strand:- start:2247 stop:2606 length:360 start_codon:yes stop_codon:yes gene_type:complete
MPAIDSITLTFDQPIQDSVQVGDTVYYTNDPNGVEIVMIGLITSLYKNPINLNYFNTLDAQIPSNTIRPNSSSFILFSKTNATNINSIIGYFLETEMRNDSLSEIELFSVGTEIFESSK